MISILVVFASIVALGFLIFIHELGHYYMAKRVGMKVEVFSIGFGSPIYSWLRDGVKWQIGWIPLGGYVKIAGTETDKGEDLFAQKEGFFGKTPWERIKVAFMGPAVNIVFALLVFALLWASGGREKSFSEFTKVIGWIDPQSELYAKGVRPGDEILSYNDESYQQSKDHLSQPLTSGPQIKVKGLRVNYGTEDKTPFEATVQTYLYPWRPEAEVPTSGIINPASYLIYDKLPNGAENPLPEGSPLIGSGLQYGDRVVWVDGHLIFSQPQLTSLINEGRALLTVQRGHQILLLRAPSLPVEEFRLDPSVKEELVDWQYEANLKGIKLQNLLILPYNLTHEGVVENRLKFIDKEKEEEVFSAAIDSYIEAPLQPRDRIIAVDGVPVKYAYEIVQRLQNRLVSIIVERGPTSTALSSAQEADKKFIQSFELAELDKIAHRLGTSKEVSQVGPYVLLKGVRPQKRGEIALSAEKQAWAKSALLAKQKQIEGIEDPELRGRAQMRFDKMQNELVIGLPPTQDLKISYNPGPVELFLSVFTEIKRTFSALLSGSLNAKWLSGPVGIVQVVSTQGMMHLNEMLFWIGVISLNLGVLNLLPIPMLDGGTIMFCLFEMITGKRIPPKVLEKIVLPFAILLIIFFVYVTYHDLERLLGGFLRW